MNELFDLIYHAVKMALSAPIDEEACCDGCASGGPCEGWDDGGYWSATKPPVKLPGPVWNPVHTPWGNGTAPGGYDPTLQHPEGPAAGGHFDAQGHWVPNPTPGNPYVQGTLGPGGVWQGPEIPPWQAPQGNPGQDPTHNNPPGKAPTCPPGYVWDGFSCTSQFGDHTCPAGQHFDSRSQTCVPNAGPIVNCPPGYRAQNGQCVPISRSQSTGGGRVAGEGGGSGLNLGPRGGTPRGGGTGGRYSPGNLFGGGRASGGRGGSINLGTGEGGGSGLNLGGRTTPRGGG